MAHYHAVTWIDHQKATVWSFSEDDQKETVVHAKYSHHDDHSHRTAHGGREDREVGQFFDDVARVLDGAGAILVIGPAQTPEAFAKHTRAKHPQLGKAIVAVEAADHPTDAQVLAYARKHFAALDRLRRD